MHKHGFLQGLCGCFLEGSGHTPFTHHTIIPRVFGFCIMKLMTCRLTEVRLFFVVWMFVTVHMQECMCTCSFTCNMSLVVWVCACVNRVCTSVLMRACAPSVAVARGSQGRALFAPSDTRHFAINYWQSPHIFSISSYLSAHSTPAPHQHTNTLKGNSTYASFHRAVWQRNRRPANWSLLSCYSPNVGIRTPNTKPHNLHAPGKLIIVLRDSVSVSISLFHPSPSLFRMETRGAVPSGCVSK